MNQEQMVQRPANLGLNVICLVTVVCIVLKSIYSNLFLSVLRFFSRNCLFNVQYFSQTRSRSNSKFSRDKSFTRENNLLLVLFFSQ